MKAWQKHVFSSLDPFIMFPGIKTKTCLLPALSLFTEELEFSPEFWVVGFAVKSHKGLCRPLLAHWKGQEERSCINPCGSEWCASKLELRSTCWGSPVNNPVKQNKTRAELESLCWKKCKWKYLPSCVGLPNPQMIWHSLPLQGLENLFCIKSYMCS